MSGRDDRIRTCDLLIPNQALYQAEPHPDNAMAEERGFEPLRRFTDLLAFETSPFSRLGIPPSDTSSSSFH